MHSASIRSRQRSDGTLAFDVRYRISGQSRSTSFDNERAATAWAKVVRQRGPEEAVATLQRDVSTDVPTLNEYAERYIAGKSGVEGKTTDHYSMFMRISIGPAFGDLPISLITEDMVAEWVNAQAAEGKASKTIKNRHGFLSAVFQQSVDRGVTTRNPCAHTRIPRTVKREMTFLSPDEYTVLAGFIPDYYKPLLHTLAGTGMRWGEVTALQRGDFDFYHSTIRVSRAWKHSKDRGWYIGVPKTQRSNRSIAVSAELMAILRPIVEASGEYVFVTEKGRHIRQQTFYKSVWYPARNLANGNPAAGSDRAKADPQWVSKRGGYNWPAPASLDLRIHKMPRIHDLRHTHASWLINAGIPLTTVQRRLGHESIQTTSDTYGHIAPDGMALAVQATGAAMAGALPQLEG